MIFGKKTISEYTESEFLALVEILFNTPEELKGQNLSKTLDDIVEHIVKITEHPDKTDLIFYPKEGQEDSPEGILKEIKEWRAANGKLGFKLDNQ